MQRHSRKFVTCVLSVAVFMAPMTEAAIACTRTLYVGDDNTVITGATWTGRRTCPPTCGFSPQA